MIPRMRLTVFVTGCAADMTVYTCNQVLQHGEMPLPTLDVVIDLVNTNTRGVGIVVTQVRNDDELQRELESIISAIPSAVRTNLRFEVHIFDHRSIGRPVSDPEKANVR